MWTSVSPCPEATTAVHNVLGIVENVVEIRQDAAGEFFEKSKLLAWLLKRVAPKKETDNNKLYASEVLAILGRAVQVDPIKPTLNAPGSMLLKRQYDGPASKFAFNFNLRRYTACSPPRRTVRDWARQTASMCCCGRWRRTRARTRRQGLTLVHFSAQPEPFLTLKTSQRRVNTPSTPAKITP